jgi:hypothetical protein
MVDGITIGPVSSDWVPASCQAAGGSNDPGPVLRCMEAAGYRQFMTFQPADRYWAFQGIEACLFLVLAAALMAVTFAVVNRRDA